MRDGRAVAECYVCDEPMAEWGGTMPLPVDVERAVTDHRLSHLDGARAEPTKHRRQTP